MATMLEHEIVNTIKSISKKSKRLKKNVPVELSGGRDYYYKAIYSIQSAGVWTRLFLIISYIIGATSYTLNCISNNAFDVTAISALIVLALALIAPIYLSCRLAKLDITPTFALVSLIICTISNLLFSVGILPIISLVMCIIALVRWSTFKDWFYNIDPDRSK